MDEGLSGIEEGIVVENVEEESADVKDDGWLEAVDEGPWSIDEKVWLEAVDDSCLLETAEIDEVRGIL